MKAKIESAKDTGRTFQGKNGEVHVYEVVAAIDSKAAEVFEMHSSECLNKIGQEVDGVSVYDASDPKYHRKLYFPKAGGGKGFFTGGGGGKGYGDPVMTAKTMLMAYAKDLTVALITGGHIKTEEAVNKDLLLFYDAMAKKIIPTTPPASAPEHKPAETLSQAKQAIIMQRCKLLNFKAKDLIDFAGAIGLEIKYDTANDTALIGQLDDQSAQHLINSLQDAAR